MTVDDLYGRLERADAAGDKEAAKVIADEIRRLQAAPKALPARPAPAAEKPGLYDEIRKHTLPGGTARATLDFLDAGVHHVGSQMAGLGQLIHKGVTAASDLLPEGNAVREWAHEVDQRGPGALANREAAYQRRVPDSAASYTGAAAGEVLPWLTGVAELRAAGALPQIVGGGTKALAQKGGLLALEGGAMGASQPVMDDDYASTKAAQIGVGAAAAPVLAGSMAGLGAMGRYVTPSGREIIANDRIARLYGTDADTIAKLRTGTDVEGFDLSPGQAIGTPEAVQAERSLRNNPAAAPAFARQDAMNNAAVRNQVARVAKDDPALDLARDSRRSNANAFRAKHLPEQGSVMVDAAPIFDQLQRLSLSANPVIRGAAREHFSLLRKQAVDGKVPAYALDDIRQNAGATIAKHTPMGGGASKEAAKYGPVTDQIADTLDRAIPGYRDYLAAYARDSQPINDMQAARLLLDAIDSGRRDTLGNQNVSLTQVKALLAKDNRANFPMSNQARKEIEAVLEALQKRSITDNSMAASGPGTAADVQRALQSSPWLMRLLGHGASVGGGVALGPYGYLAGAALTEGAAAANNAVVRKVGEKAASAPQTAAAIEAARRRQMESSLSRLLLPYDARSLPPPR